MLRFFEPFNRETQRLRRHSLAPAFAAMHIAAHTRLERMRLAFGVSFGAGSSPSHARSHPSVGGRRALHLAL